VPETLTRRGAVVWQPIDRRGGDQLSGVDFRRLVARCPGDDEDGPDRELAETGRAISVGPNGLDSKPGFTSSAVAKGRTRCDHVTGTR